MQCSEVTCLRRHLSQAAAVSGPREHIKVDNSEQSEHGPCLICSGVMKQQPSGAPISAPLPLPEQVSPVPNFHLTSRGLMTPGLCLLTNQIVQAPGASWDTDMTQRKPGSLLKTQSLLDNSLPNSLCAMPNYLPVSYFCVIVQVSLLGSHMFIT